MNPIQSNVQISRLLRQFASGYRRANVRPLELDALVWDDNTISATGRNRSRRVDVAFEVSAPGFFGRMECSVCGTRPMCDHFRALIVAMDDANIAERIEASNFAPMQFSFDAAGREAASKDQWRSKLGRLDDLLSCGANRLGDPAKLPIGREIIYVLDLSPYRTRSRETLAISVATRAVAKTASDAGRSIPPRSGTGAYRHLKGGVAVWRISPDPLDRELANLVGLTSNEHRDSESGITSFNVSVNDGADLLGRLARSGRLYANAEFSLMNDMPQIGWLSDDPFELKFEVAARNDENLNLRMCLSGNEILLRVNDLLIIQPRFFIDRMHRLGLLARSIPADVVSGFMSESTILVPRAKIGDLVERLTKMPLGLGIEFNGCEELRPTRVEVSPRARIRIKAAANADPMLYAEVHFDYDGRLVPLGTAQRESYDKSSHATVPLDLTFHAKCLEHLASLGVKIQSTYQGVQVALPAKKLPVVVSNLIREGWHVEADGKLYRTGSTFELKVVSGIDWFELQGTANFSDATSVDLPRLLQSLRAGEATVLLDDGSMGLIPEAWIKQFGGLSELGKSDAGTLKFERSQVGLLDALLIEQGEVNVDATFSAARESLRGFDRVVAQEPPSGFVGELRPYQKLALGWFEFLRQLGFGGCLADDMGLGKTIQVLAMLEDRRARKAGPSLIVVPRSLIFNWTSEAKKFAPNLRILDQSHSQRKKNTDHLADFDIVLTTYGTLRKDAAFLREVEFDYVILDEAQAIKNATTAGAKAVRLLRAQHRLALSGTPIENHLGELWSLFDFLNPGMLGRVGRFAGMAQDADADQRKLLGSVVRPFILRRTKKQVAPELPDRIEQTIIVELDAEQRRSYDELRDHYRKSLLNKIAIDGVGKSQFMILEALLRLRQAACHPGLVDKARLTEPSAKIDELLARLNNAVQEGERVLVFSQFTSLLAIVQDRLKEAGLEFLYLDGKTRDRQALVNQFQSGTGPSVFLISLKAGGVGLNLTAARTVFLLDPWWNPAVEAQAIDRAHRIGQAHTVFATRLIAADTVEQKVLELQAKKRGLADAIINADNAGISSLTKEDLELLLA